MEKCRKYIIAHRYSFMLWAIVIIVVIALGVYTYFDRANITYDGLYTVNACNVENRCYALQANVVNVGTEEGQKYLGVYVTRLYFDNGGHLDMECKLGGDGYCNDTSDDSMEWKIDLIKRIGSIRK